MAVTEAKRGFRMKISTPGMLMLIATLLCALTYAGLFLAPGFAKLDLWRWQTEKPELSCRCDKPQYQNVVAAQGLFSHQLGNASTGAASPTALSSTQPYNASSISISSPCSEPLNQSSSPKSPSQSPELVSSFFKVNMTDMNYIGMEGDHVCSNGSANRLKLNTSSSKLLSPIVVVGYKRVNYLARCLMALLRHWKADSANEERYPLFVSVDGTDAQVLSFAAAFRESTGLQVISRVRNPATCDNSECHISLHYKMLLQLFFKCLKSPRLIFLEEDLEAAPDFFSYFTNMAPLLAQDKTLQCISCWNDHAQKGRALNTTALYRTDIFPGLGWMVDRERALKWVDMWPQEAWDHWLRLPSIRQGQSCIFPEMPRVLHYGRIGTHTQGKAGQAFYNAFLANIISNAELIDWSTHNLTYLLKDNYDHVFNAWLAAAQPFNRTLMGDLKEYCDSSKPLHADQSDMYVTYQWSDTDKKHEEYQKVTEKLPGMITDIVGAKPRTSYNGVVVLRCRGRRLFLKPVPLTS